MPTIEVTIGRLDESRKRPLAASIAQAFIGVGTPKELIKIIFRHIAGQDLALADGSFPFWPKEGEELNPRPARVEVTGDGLDDSRKRQVATGIGSALVQAGVPEEAISMVTVTLDPPLAAWDSRTRFG